MGPVIILDKSSIQSLSSEEIFRLHHYYFVNITPILIIEILADLKKVDKRNPIPEDNVKSLARKLLQANSKVNAHYGQILIGSLLGNPAHSDGRPAATPSKYVIDNEGRKGVIYEESKEEEAIRKWKDGEFTIAENALAERWRKSTEALNLEQFKHDFSGLLPELRNINSFDELNDIVMRRLSESSAQTNLLKWTLGIFGIESKIAQKVFTRWELGGFNNLMEFAPYALHCLKVNLFFYFGLISELIGTKPTNRIDAEYYYYLPFCNVFSSNDKLQTSISKYFLTDNQLFIKGEKLKSDLALLNPEQLNLDKYSNSSSPTISARNKFNFVTPNKNDNRASNLTEKQKKVIISKSKELSDLPDERDKFDGSMLDDSEIDFMIIKRSYSKEDLCPCGNGKRFGDCHWEEVTKNG